MRKCALTYKQSAQKCSGGLSKCLHTHTQTNKQREAQNANNFQLSRVRYSHPRNE
jgi:hypothetical protein